MDYAEFFLVGTVCIYNQNKNNKLIVNVEKKGIKIDNAVC